MVENYALERNYYRATIYHLQDKILMFSNFFLTLN